MCEIHEDQKECPEVTNKPPEQCGDARWLGELQHRVNSDPTTCCKAICPQRIPDCGGEEKAFEISKSDPDYEEKVEMLQFLSLIHI